MTDDPWTAAERKADDPNMTLNGNPLRMDYAEWQHRDLVDKNLDRLHRDARAWNDQRHGAAYRAIRSMTLRNKEN